MVVESGCIEEEKLQQFAEFNVCARLDSWETAFLIFFGQIDWMEHGALVEGANQMMMMTRMIWQPMRCSLVEEGSTIRLHLLCRRFPSTWSLAFRYDDDYLVPTWTLSSPTGWTPEIPTDPYDDRSQNRLAGGGWDRVRRPTFKFQHSYIIALLSDRGGARAMVECGLDNSR